MEKYCSNMVCNVVSGTAASPFFDKGIRIKPIPSHRKIKRWDLFLQILHC